MKRLKNCPLLTLATARVPPHYLLEPHSVPTFLGRRPVSRPRCGRGLLPHLHPQHGGSGEDDFGLHRERREGLQEVDDLVQCLALVLSEGLVFHWGLHFLGSGCVQYKQAASIGSAQTGKIVPQT